MTAATPTPTPSTTQTTDAAATEPQTAPPTDPTTDPKEPTSARLILTLGFAGFFSGLAIVAIYEVTLPTITANKARELREAVFKVLPGVSQLKKLAFKENQMVADAKPGKDVPFVYGGYDGSGAFVGYAIPANGVGFQDTIGLLFGYKPANRLVVGMEILESRETPGLGDKIFKDAAFVANFKALAIDPTIALVKKGKKNAANEVDAITGATISSKAVVKIINVSLKTWLPRLPPTGVAVTFSPPAEQPEQPKAKE